MGLFRRRPPGRHAASAGRVAPVAVPPWEQPGWSAAVPAPGESPVVPVPSQAAPPAWNAPPGPRVELGFRDGSTAALAPDSAQARALTAIADVLTRRD